MTGSGKRSLLTCALGTVVVMASLLSAAGPSEANQAGEADLQGPNVIRYPHGDNLTNHVRFLVQGDRLLDGGCGFRAELTRVPGQPLSDRELAYDPDTCRSLRERGYQQGATPGPPPNASQGDGAIVRASGPSASPSSLSATTAGYSNHAFIRSWFHDPRPVPNFTVNRVTNTVDWNPDGTCALAGDAQVSYLYEWNVDVNTGWTLEDNNWNRGANCDGVFSSSYVKFQNRVFCPALFLPTLFFPTVTEYDRNNVTGLPSGRARYTYGWRKSGSCSNLLGYDQVVG